MSTLDGKTLEIRDRLRDRFRSGPPLLLDAAMGTELERRGIDSRLPLWSARALIDAPDIVLSIHRENARAGADVLTANTFRTHRRSLAKEGLGDVAAELTRKAVSLARRAARESGRDVFVFGSLSPLEDCYRPDLVASDSDLEREHGDQARALAEAGVDAILAETQNTVVELVAAVRAATDTGVPVIASIVTDGEGRLLSGERIEEAVGALAPFSAEMLAINCVAAPALASDLRRLAAAAPGVPLAAYGNTTRLEREMTPETYAELARDWIGIGAVLVGGCCGTDASHTSALRRLIG
jgi:S-methylmethionine-dependent homocysteine/selenocysteine methylase